MFFFPFQISGLVEVKKIYSGHEFEVSKILSQGNVQRAIVLVKVMLPAITKNLDISKWLNTMNAYFFN